jgi:hypothetical protein
MMCVEITCCVSMPRGAGPDRLLDAGRDVTVSGRDGCLPAIASSVGRDVWVPGAAGGDDRVQLPQDRGGDHGLRLGRGELVLRGTTTDGRGAKANFDGTLSPGSCEGSFVIEVDGEQVVDLTEIPGCSIEF